MIAIGAGIAIAGTGIGTAWAQKEIGAAAVGAAAENEKMFVRGIVYMVIPETIVLFGLVIAYMLMGKV
ncbi:MAG: ATPase [Thermoplasmatota archaeon]